MALSSVSIQPELVACPIELLARTQNAALLDAALRTGSLRRVQPGVYADAEAWSVLPGWEKYLARVYAVHLRRPQSVFLLESAATLLGLPVIGATPYVHVLAHTTSASRIVGSVQAHYATHPAEIDDTDAVSHTSILDTTIDIARSRHPVYAIALLNHVARHFDLHPAEVEYENEQRQSARGRAAASWAIERMSPVPESVLESVSLALIEWLGFPQPELQVRFDLGQLGAARVDMFWRGDDVIGEADGSVKYRMPGHDPGTSIIAEKRREDALRRLSRGFARWGWNDCRSPGQLERALLTAGLRRVRSPDHARLRTAASFLAR